jgi:hypothetical protein
VLDLDQTPCVPHAFARLASVLPRITIVLGKGGVGRSTVSAALALALAARGERVLVLEWALTESIAPWFGGAPAGTAPVLVAPNVSVANYRLDEALRAYFVDHLRLRRFHKHVIAGPHLGRLIEAAPGISELLFLGQLWWLSTLAPEEAGLRFDRIVVDAPATGHGASLLDMPATLASMGATGLLGLEVGRVTQMMRDPSWTGTVLVALPEELAVEETLELLPRVTAILGRKPVGAFVNRSAVGLVDPGRAWLDGLAVGPETRGTLANVQDELLARVRIEEGLQRSLEGTTERGTCSLDDQLASVGRSTPAEIVHALAAPIGAHLEVGT